MLENNDKYFEVLNDIKKTLITTRNKMVENANKDLVLMYYNVGLKLIENNKWGICKNLLLNLKMMNFCKESLQNCLGIIIKYY